MRARAAAQQIGEALRRAVNTRHINPFDIFTDAVESESLHQSSSNAMSVDDDNEASVSRGALQRAIERASLGFAPSDVAAAVGYAADEAGLIVCFEFNSV